MLAFAANSLLCRLALGFEQIDAASFASVRLISGAVMMGMLLLPGIRARERYSANWRSVFSLFTYMICFSLAYLSLAAGTGALILFGAVQLTMILSALRSGERLSPAAWFGLALAVIGLVYLVSPGVSAPDPLGAVLMTIAGIAWGFYSLFGRSAADPMQATAYNFLYAVPFALLVSALLWRDFAVTPSGIGLAVASGALASGLGYFVWYLALKKLAAVQAATVQLSVPVIAAIGGVVFIAEPMTLRLLVASVATLGGIAIVLMRRRAA